MNGWLIKAYSWFKFLHIVSVVAWMAGLLSLLVRIFTTFFSQFASVTACRDFQRIHMPRFMAVAHAMGRRGKMPIAISERE